MTNPLHTRALVRNRIHRMEQGNPAIDTADDDCPHPLRSLRYDGIQEMADGSHMASVTCTVPDCLRSFLIPIREDEQARLQNGGSRQHGGTDSVVSIPHDGREATP